MRPRTLLFIALVILLGAVVVVLPAQAAPSQESLEVNYECHNLTDWPCWTHPGQKTYVKTITIAQGGVVKFSDEGAAANGVEANIVWTSTPAGPPHCTSGVPIGPTMPAQNGWNGECKFEQSGTYDFESSTMFHDTYEDYRHYEIIVVGPPTPTATTEQATGVTETEATLNGSVSPEGEATEYEFEYGTATVSEHKTTPASVGAADFTSHAVSLKFTNLSPDTAYHFEVVAIYGVSKTRVLGGEMTFKTLARPGPPMASTQPATEVTETEATLKGTVNPEGEATKYFFEYGTETSHGQKTEEVTLPASENNQAVSATVKGLAPGTEYHFRLVAENKHGSGEGVDSSFKTMSTPAKEPTKEPPAKEPSPTPSATTISQGTSTTPAQSTTTQSEKAIKSLTRAQKLAKALKQCKKQPKKKRAKCEATAKKLYGPRHKSHKK